MGWFAFARIAAIVAVLRLFVYLFWNIFWEWIEPYLLVFLATIIDALPTGPDDPPAAIIVARKTIKYGSIHSQKMFQNR